MPLCSLGICPLAIPLFALVPKSWIPKLGKACEYSAKVSPNLDQKSKTSGGKRSCISFSSLFWLPAASTCHLQCYRFRSYIWLKCSQSFGLPNPVACKVKTHRINEIFEYTHLKTLDYTSSSYSELAKVHGILWRLIPLCRGNGRDLVGTLFCSHSSNCTSLSICFPFSKILIEESVPLLKTLMLKDKTWCHERSVMLKMTLGNFLF